MKVGNLPSVHITETEIKKGSILSSHIMRYLSHEWFLVHRDGIPFVAVHDSYWTHACFVDDMNRVRDCVIHCIKVAILLLWLRTVALQRAVCGTP